jgi:hypothetical protein
LHATKYESADNSVDAVIWKGQVIRSSISQIDLYSESSCLFFEIGIHEVIGLNANPSDVIFGKVLKIGACAWPNFKDSARQLPEELPLVVRHESLVLRIVRKGPCKRSLPPRTCPVVAFVMDHACS